jgi:hypothetical protein
MNLKTVIIVVLILYCISISSCAVNNTKIINEETLNNPTESEIEKSSVGETGTSYNETGISYDNISFIQIGYTTETVISIPYLGTSADDSISIYVDSERPPEAFAVFNDYVFIVDTLNASILILKDNTIYSNHKFEYPFSDMMDICVVKEDEYYIFNQPFERGIFLYKNNEVKKIDSELYEYKGLPILNVFGNKAFIGAEQEYLDLSDGFHEIRSNPWDLKCEGEYLIDLETNNKYKIFSVNKHERLLGMYSDKIYIESYDNFNDRNNRERFINIFDEDNKKIFTMKIENNKFYCHRDLYIDENGNIYLMLFEENRLVIKKIKPRI